MIENNAIINGAITPGYQVPVLNITKETPGFYSINISTSRLYCINIITYWYTVSGIVYLSSCDTAYIYILDLNVSNATLILRLS